ncbi:MAG TPA: Gfo/Idh/MocA family oxidoreductase [Bryobacteraceae bacterium]|nr:Gfo/Idh/MocA family oxidoreductase [Bryobacteraceae bacterium]
MNRRHFLMSTAAAAGALRANALASPNNRVRVACVGVRGQGRSHIEEYAQMKDVEIAALCDVDSNVLNDRLALVEKLSGKKPAGYSDLRKLLEDKSIDAISIATPNHHHTLQTIWGLQAGKDVYCEKPCSYNMFEARQIVAAAKKYGRVVQHGTNSRSSVSIREAVQHMREGLLGEVYMARGLCFKWRDTIGRTPVSAVPAGVDYDLWLGPAPKKEFTRNHFHYNWHWFWDYGNGDMGNQGIHEMDIARWGLGVKYPTRVTALGGHFMFDDDQETPNTLTALFEFEDGGKKKMLEFAVRHWVSNHEAGVGEGKERAETVRGEIENTVGNLFYGSKGYMAIDGYTRYWTVLGPIREGNKRFQQPGPSLAKEGNNWANFIDVVRSRKLTDLNAPIEEGAISTTLVHLANISYRLGRSIRFDAASYTCPGDKEATAMFTRHYRAPFVVPEHV